MEPWTVDIESPLLALASVVRLRVSSLSFFHLKCITTVLRMCQSLSGS